MVLAAKGSANMPINRHTIKTLNLWSFFISRAEVAAQKYKFIWGKFYGIY
jgi:hypothetical protein